MKNSKKLKIITSSAVIATAAAITPLVATSCTTTDNINTLNNPNEGKIDIAKLTWVEISSFETTDEATIINQVRAYNSSLFALNPGLRDAITIKAPYDSTKPEGEEITITITASGDVYEGTKTWNATYIAPPEPTPTRQSIIIDASLIPPTMEFEQGGGMSAQITAKLFDGTDITDWTKVTVVVNSTDTSVFTVSNTAGTNSISISMKSVGSGNLTIKITDDKGNWGFVSVPVTLTSSSTGQKVIYYTQEPTTDSPELVTIIGNTIIYTPQGGESETPSFLLYPNSAPTIPEESNPWHLYINYSEITPTPGKEKWKATVTGEGEVGVTIMDTSLFPPDSDSIWSIELKCENGVETVQPWIGCIKTDSKKL